MVNGARSLEKEWKDLWKAQYDSSTSQSSNEFDMHMLVGHAG